LDDVNHQAESWVQNKSPEVRQLKKGEKMKKNALIFVMTVICGVAFATVITHGTTSLSLSFVNIGAVGNAADNTGFGAVSYKYNIAKFATTQADYEMVRAVVGGDTALVSGTTQGVATAIGSISWNSAAKYCNWLTTGDFNTGVYSFNGSGVITGIMDRATAYATYGVSYALPTENEWYKAAYYSVAEGVYYDWATGSDTKPSEEKGTGENIGGTVLWNVGEGAMEVNGTYDMGGNKSEWTESLVSGGGSRYIRSAYFGWSNNADSSKRTYKSETYENDGYGMRIMQIIPEPASMTLIGVGALIIALFRRRLLVK
jgi:hypothetical protein